MSWCPRCDEVFPEGRHCPRCGAPLVAGEDAERRTEPIGGNLPQLKVPRRMRRAFDRLSGDPAPPRQLMALAVACLLFAGGFVLGRLGTVPADRPALQMLTAAPLPLDLEGFVEYVARPPGPSNEPALVRHELQTGQITSVHRFSLPFTAPAAGTLTTEVATFEDSSAIVLGGEDRSFVGAFPGSRAMPLWTTGSSAAWESGSSLLVHNERGVQRWSFDEVNDPVPERLDGEWAALYPTHGGAVLEASDERSRRLVAATSSGLVETIALPADGRVLAVAPAANRALLVTSEGAVLWDGERATPVVAEGMRPRAASFSPGGDRVAITFAEPRRGTTARMLVGVADSAGGVAFHRVATADERCRAVPAWESSERWVYLAPGNGSVYAIEVGGGTVRGTHTRMAGCGLAWNA